MAGKRESNGTDYSYWTRTREPQNLRTMRSISLKSLHLETFLFLDFGILQEPFSCSIGTRPAEVKGVPIEEDLGSVVDVNA